MARQPRSTTSPTTKKPAARRRPAKPQPKSAAKGAPAASAKSASPPPRPRVTLPGVGAASTRLRTVLLNFAFLAAFLVLVPVIASQFWRNEVLIDRIPVPAALGDLGLTPDVAASRLWDGLRDAALQARTSKQSLVAIPNAKRVQFSLPESGFSMESLIQQTRQFFHAYQTRISGEFTCSDPACGAAGIRLRLRVLRDRTDVIDLPPLGDTPLRDYFANAAVQVLSILDPFVAIAAISETQSLRATVLARNLIRQWAHNLIGMLKGTEDAEGAITEYGAALALDPDFVIARANLASTLVGARRFDEARPHYDRLAALAPEDTRILAGLAEFAFAEERYADARDHLLRGMALAPKDPFFVTRMGDIWFARGDDEKATGYLRRALQLDPSYLPALGSLGLHYLNAGDFAAAEPLYADFVEYSPDDVGANMMYARLLQARGELTTAIERYDHALTLAPDNAALLTEAAGALTLVDRIADAIALLERALLIDDANAMTYAQLARLQMLTSSFEQANASYRRALELEPENLEILDAAAFCLSAGGRHAEAVVLAEKVVALSPGRFTSYFSLGNYYKFAGDDEKALAAFERFLQLTPVLPVFAESRSLAERVVAELGAPAAPTLDGAAQP